MLVLLRHGRVDSFWQRETGVVHHMVAVANGRRGGYVVVACVPLDRPFYGVHPLPVAWFFRKTTITAGSTMVLRLGAGW
jgi:hypothetical protein